jgi:arylsulfatase A-like enzyme
VASSEINGNDSFGNFRLAFVISTVAGLIIALSDALGILPFVAARSSMIGFLFAPLAAKMGIIVVVYWLLWLILRAVSGILKLDIKGLSFGLGVFIVASYRLYSLHSKIGFGGLPADFRMPIAIVGCVLTVAVFTLVTYFLVRAWEDSKWKGLAGSVCLSIAFLLIETMVVLWFAKYMFEPLLSDRAALKAKLFSATSLLVNIGYLVCVIGTLFVFVRLRGRHLAVRLHQGLALMIIVSSILVLLFSGAGNMPKAGEEAGHRIKHVILIVIDTMRSDGLSCYGNPNASTPQIDQFASDSILFKDAFAASPWTSPSMATILTGLSPSVHMTTDYKSILPGTLETIGERMRNAGYLTHAIGSNPVLVRRNFSQGFMGYNVFPKSRDNTPLGKILELFFPMQFVSKASTSDLTEMAVEWISENADNDFFLWLHYFDPHGPYEPPAEYLEGYTPVAGVGRRFGAKESIRGGFLKLSSEQRDGVRALYDAEVRYVDDNIGSFLAHLKKLEIYDDALIVLTGDHGEEFWEHDGYEHGHSLYNEQLKVPLIIKLPGGEGQKAIVDQRVSLESLTPTLLDLCQIDYEDGYMSGESLVSTWSGGGKDRPLFSTGVLLYEEKEAVIFEDLKYIRSLVTGREELYDLSEDPGEENNIFHTSESEAEKLKELLSGHKVKSEILKRHHFIDKGEQVEPDADTMRQLKSLGYVE